MPSEGPKISGIEAFLLICYVGILDIIGMALLLFGLDDGFILDLAATPVTQLYLRMKQVSRAGLDLMVGLVELIPWVGGLPFKTIGIILVIFADWHPDSFIAKTTERAGSVVSVAKGSPGGGGGLKK